MYGNWDSLNVQQEGTGKGTIAKYKIGRLSQT